MTQLAPLNLDEINLASPEVFGRGAAHDIWRRLRAQAPVCWNRPGSRFLGFWSITKYEDVLAISRDPATFISGKGITLVTDPEHPQPASGMGKMLIVTDPPRHVRLRRLVNKGFTPRVVAQLTPRIRQLTLDIIDDVAPRGACDFVADIAAPPLVVRQRDGDHQFPSDFMRHHGICRRMGTRSACRTA